MTEIAERIGLPLEKDRVYEIVGGLVLEKIGTLPKVGDPDGRRIDKRVVQN